MPSGPPLPELAPSVTESPAYRLRGRVDGQLRTFPIPAGEHRIGSAGDNLVMLPVAGVSRRHARIETVGRVLVVEDLDSRNGTFLNGERIQCREIFPGDLLRLGPVTLELERIAAADATLGLVLSPSPGLGAAPSPSVEADETTALLSGDGPLHPDPTAGLVFPDGIVRCRSEAMSRLYRSLAALARAELPVVIEGETGVGKESVARLLHLSSSRRSRPFIAVNCAAIPAELLEAEMFGIDEGVATGVRKRQGKFRDAEGGTLFLDEIAEIPLAIQAKLLRALQEKEIQPLGGGTVAVDVRIVAATNHELLRRVETGDFRRDLYYRVAGGVVQVPALRDRREDIPLLVEHFLRQAAAAAQRHIPGVTVRALDELVRSPWPGNIRQLEHQIRRTAYLCGDGQAIDAALLDPSIRGDASRPETRAPIALPHPDPPAGSRPAAPATVPSVAPQSLRLQDHVEALERRLIRRALDRAGGSQRQAARLLGISRSTLARKIDKLGIPT